MNEYKKLLQELKGKRDKAQMELRDLHVRVDVLTEMIFCLEYAMDNEKAAKEPTDEKRELVEKIAEVGCQEMDDLFCTECPLNELCACSGESKDVAKKYLINHPKKDKPCPRCDGNGTVSELVMSPNGSSSTMTPKKCPLCLGTGKRLTRADLEAEVVRLREGR